MGYPLIHYHGGPITPETCAHKTWAGRHACISWAHSYQIELAAAICQSFILDNGAFSLWKAGTAVDWPDYYVWSGDWLRHPGCDWAIIPDVIGGTEQENDALVAEWPHGHRGVPVWHLNESIDRLVQLAADWPRVALGSAAEYDVSSPWKCINRLADALPAISDGNGRPLVKLHGLRMLNPAIVTKIPLASADSTNVARNIGIDAAWSHKKAPATKELRATILVEHIERHQAPTQMMPLDTPLSLFGEAI